LITCFNALPKIGSCCATIVLLSPALESRAIEETNLFIPESMSPISEISDAPFVKPDKIASKFC